MAIVLSHLGSVLTFTFFVLAPLPLALTIVARHEGTTKERLSLPQALLIVLTAWCLVQVLVTHGLALVHQLRFPGIVVADIVVFAAGLFALSRHRGSALDILQRGRGLGPLDTVALLTLVVMGLLQLWWSAARPIIDWDSWAFHLPHMVEWLQSGTFTRLAQGAERMRNYYPYSWEAVCALFLTPFGEDVLVTFPNLVVAALLALATYLLARLWHAQRTHAIACAACLLAIPAFAEPLNTMHVDIPFAAMIVVGAYYGAWYAHGSGPAALGLCAATIGLACATRSTGPLYAAVVAPWLLFLCYQRGRTTSLLADARHPAALLGIAVGSLIASFWYLKNLSEVGNLLGPGTPLSGPEAGHRGWSYFAARTLAFTVNPLSAADWKAIFDRIAHELDVPFVTLVAFAILWLIASWRHGRLRDGSGMAVALLLSGTLIAFVFTPLSALSTMQLRLGLSFVSVVAIAAAVGATRARVPPILSVTLAVLGTVRTFSSSRTLLPLMVLAMVIWGVWRAWPPTWRLSRARIAATIVIILSGFALITFVARDRRERERYGIYGPFYAVLEQRVPATEPIAYLLSERPYLFYGRRLQRSLFYAPLDPNASVDAWVERLRQRGIRVVAVGPWDDKPVERATVTRLVAPAGPLMPIAGNGAPGVISLFRLDDN